MRLAVGRGHGHERRRVDRRRLLRRAWAIARAGATRFGGLAVHYIAGSLRLAWQERRDHLAALA